MDTLMHDNKYKIGQVLFVVPHKPPKKIVPIIVVEEVVRTTIDGVKKTYHVKGLDDPNVYDLTRITGEIFLSLDDVRTHLLNSVSKEIDLIISETHALLEADKLKNKE